MSLPELGHLLIWLLIVAILLTVAYLVITKWIMPAIAPQFQLYIWAIMGVCILIAIIYWLIGYVGHGDVLPIWSWTLAQGASHGQQTLPG
jgi:hypothetical protein